MPQESVSGIKSYERVVPEPKRARSAPTIIGIYQRKLFSAKTYVAVIGFVTPNNCGWQAVSKFITDRANKDIIDIDVRSAKSPQE